MWVMGEDGVGVEIALEQCPSECFSAIGEESVDELSEAIGQCEVIETSDDDECRID